MKGKNSSSRRFTLVELLAVISVILVLVAMFMPAFSLAMAQARKIFCGNNMRTLSLAWTTYSSDNSGYLANATANPYGNPPPPTPTAWACNVTVNPATKDDRRAALVQGSLWPYVNNYDAYHCPDHPFNRTPQELVRTYSINNFTGGWETPGGCPSSNTGYDNAPASGHVNRIGSIYNPAKTFVFLEDDDSRGDLCGGFVIGMGANSWNWTDPMGRWHGSRTSDKTGTMFSFADGHAELWRWQDARTQLISSDPATNIYAAPQTNNPDLLRVKKAVCPDNPYTPWLNN